MSEHKTQIYFLESQGQIRYNGEQKSETENFIAEIRE